MVRDQHTRRMFNLAEDIDLQAKIAEVGDVRLIQIDPISAYLGNQIDSFRTTAVRSVLAPLVDLAGTKVSIIGMLHFNKKLDVNNALLWISDSLAFGATARHVYAVVDDSEPQAEAFREGQEQSRSRPTISPWRIGSASVMSASMKRRAKSEHRISSGKPNTSR